MSKTFDIKTTITDNFDGAINNYVDKVVNAAKKKVVETLEEKQERIKKFRQEASRQASLANKRVKRLEENGLQDSPAYQGYLASGGGKFSVKGKDYNEVQAELSRLRKFIDAKTSTVRGTVNNLKNIAEMTGFKYSNLQDLKQKAAVFFELAEKTEEYLRTVEDMASAIGYEKIWEAINVYTQLNKTDLSEGKLSVDEMLEQVTKALIEHETPEYVDFSEITEGSTGQWYTLPKE